MQRFELFSPLHFATIALFALAWAVLIACGRRLRSRPLGARWRHALALGIGVCWLVANGVQLLPGRFVAHENLPLQVCDIAGLLAAFALYASWPTPRALLHFWGLGFSVVAILTPELAEGPAFAGFWTFWVPHANLTGAAAYLLLVEDYRPSWRDARTAFAWALLYLALVLPFDLWSGFNYGYVGPGKPAQATLLDFLGPWPWRLGVMTALTAAVFALLAWPWARRVTQKPRSVA
jgi:hypothetical integral membrane protein (TIGR02206 family)